MKPRQQKTTETRAQYLQAARRYARRVFLELILNDYCFKYCHESHTVAKALELTEKRFVDLGTFGVEGSPEFDLQYLNTGETYDITVCYWRGRFHVASWGDIVELGERQKVIDRS